MRSWSAAGAAAVGVVLSLAAGSAPAAPTPVASYQADFSSSGFANGWRYLYNAGGPLGNPANYVPLTLAGGQYAAPSGNLAVGQSAPDAVAYPPLPPFPPTFPNTYVRPGAGSQEDPIGIERAAILEYTIQPEDLAAAGATGQGALSITAYDFAVSTLASPDGMSARIYHGNDPTPLIEFSDDLVPPFPFPPGFRFETTLDPRPIPLGLFGAGDKVYIAVGGNNVSAGDEMRLDLTFSMEAVPEPATISFLAPAGLLLLRRRKREEAKTGPRREVR